MSARSQSNINRAPKREDKEKIREENQFTLKSYPKDVSEFTELQERHCNSSAYIKIDKCKACVAKYGDACRFKNLRLFKNNGKDLIDGSVLMRIEEAAEYSNLLIYDQPSRKKPNKVDDFNVAEIECTPIEDFNKGNEVENLKCIELFLKPTLAPVFTQEFKLLNEHKGDLRYRKMTAPINQNCDRCKTAIFCLFFLCRRCGEEICLDCYNNFEEEEDLRINPLRCKVIQKGSYSSHLREMFVPVSNFTLGAIDKFFGSINFNEVMSQNIINHLNRKKQFLEDKNSHLDNINIKSHNYPHGPKSGFTLAQFQELWQKGIPVVIELDLSTTKHNCDPNFFIQNYPNVKVEVLRLDNKVGKIMKVKNFFMGFLDPKGGLLDKKGNQIPTKIKDWPSTVAFKDYFKCLYNDFMNLVPYPMYMRYDGPFNLISHLPNTMIVPDLGPKMYNSYPNTENDAKFGTTPLHKDAADAINLMTYCSGEKKTAGAIWDIFRREDSEIIREFIRKKFKNDKIADPIHDQNYYLTDDLLNDLYKKHEIKSYRIYQKVGDAVLIPAGCAHQVRNLHHCIKIAMDYVAPESISVCAKLTSEFRKLPTKHLRCVDIISTKVLIASIWNKINEKVYGKVLFGPKEILQPSNNENNKSDLNNKSKEFKSENMDKKLSVNIKPMVSKSLKEDKKANTNKKSNVPKRKTSIKNKVEELDDTFKLGLVNKRISKRLQTKKAVTSTEL